MKILYLTGDTRVRASAFSLFVPLYRELQKSNIDIKEVNAFKMYKDGYKKDIFYNKNTDYIKRHLKATHLNKYDVIVLENPFPYWNEEWDKVKSKKVLILGDLHRFNPTNGKFPNFIFRMKDRYGIDAILTKYIETYEKDYKDAKLPVYHWPHSVDPALFKDYGLEKKYGVLSTGMLAGSIYPIRRKMYEKFKGKSYFKRIDRPKNRTDIYPDPWPVGIDYAKELNKSKACIACTSVYHYTIAKIFEIPACKSLLLCDYTEEMKSLGFRPNENFLKFNRDIVEDYERLSKQELKRICNNGYELIQNRHTVQRRTQEFIKYCENILE